jgi:hypothetical protein
MAAWPLVAKGGNIVTLAWDGRFPDHLELYSRDNDVPVRSAQSGQEGHPSECLHTKENTSCERDLERMTGIGDTAAPPFVRLPDPRLVFQQRGGRFNHFLLGYRGGGG